MMIAERHKITIFLTHKCVFNYRSQKEPELILKKPFILLRHIHKFVNDLFLASSLWGRNFLQAQKSRNNQIFPLSHFQQQIKDELSEVVQEMESHENEIKHPSKEKQMSIGRKKFNMDPKKGNCEEKNPFML